MGYETGEVRFLGIGWGSRSNFGTRTGISVRFRLQEVGWVSGFRSSRVSGWHRDRNRVLRSGIEIEFRDKRQGLGYACVVPCRLGPTGWRGPMPKPRGLGKLQMSWCQILNLNLNYV
ncbi:hypothetical protein TIFTF001_031684 [Ficus carica]|uniref:Uncharacterized protein n=1 Tax=Ficus carica TaxID=3494 RepID=A0AA88DVM3_FICCA|nr:hypothetical protein TIFTF001_031684 [Ficus carica]